MCDYMDQGEGFLRENHLHICSEAGLPKWIRKTQIRTWDGDSAPPTEVVIWGEFFRDILDFKSNAFTYPTEYVEKYPDSAMIFLAEALSTMETARDEEMKRESSAPQVEMIMDRIDDSNWENMPMATSVRKDSHYYQAQCEIFVKVIENFSDNPCCQQPICPDSWLYKKHKQTVAEPSECKRTSVRPRYRPPQADLLKIRKLIYEFFESIAFQKDIMKIRYVAGLQYLKEHGMHRLTLSHFNKKGQVRVLFDEIREDMKNAIARASDAENDDT